MKREADINGIMRRAEHEICYFAKRAIEEYYVYWQEGNEHADHEADIFTLIAKHHCLKQGQIESCQRLMKEFGMR
jgi:hypothetical protein